MCALYFVNDCIFSNNLCILVDSV